MRVTLKQIAQIAGVSRGTVDRALYDRGRVKPEVAEKIKQIAQELGYQPNRAGRALALAKNPIKIGVIVQASETPFMQLVLDGIHTATEELENLGAQVIIRQIKSVDALQQIEIIDELVSLGINGLAILPSNDELLRLKLNEIIHNHNISVITFNSDIENTKRLCFVGLNNTQSGRTASGLMGMLLSGIGKVLVITGFLTRRAHNERVNGFCEETSLCYPNIQLLDIQTCYDDDSHAEEIVISAIKNNTDIKGIFIASNGQTGVCNALTKLKMENQIKLICYDLTPENEKNLIDGKIDFLIGQDSYTQGHQPLMLLFNYLFADKSPEKEFMLTDIVIKTKYNL